MSARRWPRAAAFAETSHLPRALSPFRGRGDLGVCPLGLYRGPGMHDFYLKEGPPGVPTGRNNKGNLYSELLKHKLPPLYQDIDLPLFNMFLLWAPLCLVDERPQARGQGRDRRLADNCLSIDLSISRSLSLSLSTYVYIYIYIYVFMYVCMHMYVSLSLYIYIHVYIYIYIYHIHTNKEYT